MSGELDTNKTRAVVLASVLGSVGSVQGVSYIVHPDPDRTRQLEQKVQRIERDYSIHSAVSFEQIEALRKSLIHLELEMKQISSPRYSNPHSSRTYGGAPFKLMGVFTDEQVFHDVSDFLSTDKLVCPCDGRRENNRGGNGQPGYRLRGRIRLADRD